MQYSETLTLATKDLPAPLRAILRAAGYRKRSAFVRIYPTYHRTPGGWSGGSREFDSLIRLAPHGEAFEHRRWPAATDPGTQWKGNHDREAYPLAEREVVLSTGTFRGKTATASFAVSPETALALGLPWTPDPEEGAEG